jgi:hypothetical protein
VFDKFKVAESDKDPNYIYRWVNTDERAMLHRIDQGYEVCKFDNPEIPVEVKNDLVAQTGGVTRRRGSDLILCRIRKTVHDENVESRRRDARDRHAGVIDNMVAQAKENAEAGARQAGVPIGSGPLVFKDTAGPFKT